MSFLTYMRWHKKNDDRAYAMGGAAGLLAVLIFGVFSLSVLDHYLLRSGSLAAVISSVLVDLTNSDRGARELGGLAINPVLTAAAQAKADHMAENSYFAHVSPDGRDSWYWFRQAGYLFTYAGENLAVDFSDSIDVERAWMNSPTHRANILNGNFKEIGIATAQGFYKGRSTTFVVQMFGTPSAKSDLALGKPASVQTVSSPEEPTELAVATTEAAPVPAEVLGTEAAGLVAPAEAADQIRWWQHVVASPKSMLQYAYYALAVIVLLLLAYVTELEWKRHHLRHVGAALFLLVLMAGLFLLADLVFFSEPVLAAVL